MILIKPKKSYSFRDRAPEWVLSAGLLLWGIMIALTPDLFSIAKIYTPLLALLSQQTWAILTICVGALRLVSLTINGLWRPTAHFRAMGAAAGSVLWGSLLSISVLDSAARAPGISIFSMLMVLEFMALWFAAGDAKLADQAAKSKKESNGI